MLGFHDILGHDMIKEHFQNAMESHKVSHAYILSGEAGMGKKSLAYAFAAALQCEEGGIEPCMKCRSCKQIMSGSHPDVIRVTHEKPGSIGVDDIREQINDTVMIRPYYSDWKIYIVDEAEKMTVQAQNALLKTIEEPPSYVIILLLTSNLEALLPTIQSRCVILKLKPLPDDTIKDYLTGHMGISDEQAELDAAFARGNLGKAIGIAGSEEFRDMYERLLRVLKNVRKMDISELLTFINEMKDEGMDIYDCLDFMQVWYRDALMFKVTKDPNQLIFKEEFSAINEMSSQIGYDGFENILQAIDKARIRIEANVNMELAMELLFLTIKEN